MADQYARPGEDNQSTDIPVIRWEEPPEGPVLVLLDQRRLPAEEVELVCTDPSALVDAIRTLAVRGAPLLGIAGAYGVALAAARGFDVDEAAAALAGARPTAVNLAVGVRRPDDSRISHASLSRPYPSRRGPCLLGLLALLGV
ncbi:S-methyl-5-thioribose-1-phosphate isomerase, partial [Streptomyces sp. NPDC001215]